MAPNGENRTRLAPAVCMQLPTPTPWLVEGMRVATTHDFDAAHRSTRHLVPTHTG